MSMTEKFEHDRKVHTDKHERWNLTKNVLQLMNKPPVIRKNKSPAPAAAAAAVAAK